MRHPPLFVLYVQDQASAAVFYRETLQVEPSLDVPGMAEFPLGSGAVLGIMPMDGIRRLLAGAISADVQPGAPRAELYLRVEGAEEWLARAVGAGASLLSPVQPRDWGESAGYCMDADSHILAFAESEPDDDWSGVG